MSALDLSRLSPADAVAALRSYPRRYGVALAPVDDAEDIDEVVQRIGPCGRSALEITSDTVRTWVVLGDALDKIVVTDSPVVHPAVLDPTQREWQAPPEALGVVLGLLGERVDDIAASAGRVSGRGWERSATVAGGASVTALDVLKEAVRVGHDNLVAIESTLADVRAQ